ncbi:hypothetical protein HMI56_000944 [Coelomomyces lativittatus]|nr:hypothetical protein HMI56_000944 [Coelomomyces lativittatus]
MIRGEVRDYDPFNPASFEHILSGVDAVLLVAIHTEHTVECTRNFIETAQKIDSVKYLLFWSYLGVSFAHQTIMGSGNEEYLDIFRKYAEIESILKESKFENECVIRNGFFVQL